MELIYRTVAVVLATTNGFKSQVALLRSGEDSFYPAIHYVIGSWYRPHESAKRACSFRVRSVTEIKLRCSLTASQTASSIGPILSGFLQTVCAYALQLRRITFTEILRQGAYKGLNGVRGLAGWKCEQSRCHSPNLLPTAYFPDRAFYLGRRNYHSDSPSRLFCHARDGKTTPSQVHQEGRRVLHYVAYLVRGTP